MRIMKQTGDSYETHIENIPIVSNYKYLGITFDELINFNIHTKQVREKVQKRAKLLTKNDVRIYIKQKNYIMVMSNYNIAKY